VLGNGFAAYHVAVFKRLAQTFVMQGNDRRGLQARVIALAANRHVPVGTPAGI
jgi:hypothetical protein